MSSTTTTDRNPRIIVAEIAIRILSESAKIRQSFRPTLSKEQINQLIHSLNSHIQQLKYSYMPDEELFVIPKSFNKYKNLQLFYENSQKIKNL